MKTFDRHESAVTAAVRTVTVTAIALMLSLGLTITGARAGTTGSVIGRVIDASTRAPLAGVTVVASSPSQTAVSVTDQSGGFRFLSLSPDVYTLRFEKPGYETLTQPGVIVFADQVQTLDIALEAHVRTIARVTSHATGSLVRSGTTGDVYSVDATTASATASLVGPGALNSAYGAIASIPGVALDAGEAGWFQTVHIRGGDIDQVGYELDGIPVNRAYDNAPMTMLSSLGQQELQVYTGGVPASADAQGISGYVNQVIKTGTYPGYGTATLGIGGPAFYHRAALEVGGATPDRRLTYYVGIGGANQDLRYYDQSNGAGALASFFYPMNDVPGANGYVYVGNEPGIPLFASGIAYAIGTTEQRDTIANVHLRIPRHNELHDDIQLLYLTSEVWALYYSSQNDLGPVASALGPLTWDDSSVYTGSLLQPVVPSKIVPYYFPSSPTNRPFNAALPATQRDANDNGVAIVKLQYQHAFSTRAFLRAYGYTLYSNWFINGPNTAAQPYYGAELADYEIPDHTFGGDVNLTDQMSDKHLLSVTANFTGSNLQRYYVGYIRPTYTLTEFMNGSSCVDPATGAIVPCYPNPSGSPDYIGTNTTPVPTAPAPGVAGNWIAVNNTFPAAINQVHPRFTGFSVSDEWQPSDKLTVNAGLRIEDFKYLFGDTGYSNPVRQFLFAQFDADYCVLNNYSTPFWNGLGPCPVVGGVQTVHPNLMNGNAGSYAVTRWQPRLGFTYMLNPDTVVRGSAGVYARPPNTSWVQYNVEQTDLPSFLAQHFYAYGFNTPDHLIRPDTSYNYDFSLERHVHGTDLSFKITPFYRSTRDQLQNFYIDPQGGLESGLNVGNQRSYGVELAVQKGNFARDGLSFQFAYTYTNSKIRYQNFSGTSANVIDQLNGYIEQYNSYTAGCAANENQPQCGNGAYAANGAPSFVVNGVTVPNPYYCPTVSAACPYATQPLLDHSAFYTTYDVIPGPFAGTNGYAVPHVASLVVNYRRGKWAITPTIAYSSGASYGAPTVWPGYIPQSCTGQPPMNGQPAIPQLLSNGMANPAGCSDNGLLPLFLPDPYNGYHFDSLGAFKEPWRLTIGMGFSYDITPRIGVQLNVANLVDHCGQRGYAWDNPNICVYGALPSGIMAPAGNFYPNSYLVTPPPQMLYPYAAWLNNNNTGFLGVRVPLQVTASLRIGL